MIWNFILIRFSLFQFVFFWIPKLFRSRIFVFKEKKILFGIFEWHIFRTNLRRVFYMFSTWYLKKSLWIFWVQVLLKGSVCFIFFGICVGVYCVWMSESAFGNVKFWDSLDSFYRDCLFGSIIFTFFISTWPILMIEIMLSVYSKRRIDWFFN